jgi:hypothetical protein
MGWGVHDLRRVGDAFLSVKDREIAGNCLKILSASTFGTFYHSRIAGL